MMKFTFLAVTMLLSAGHVQGSGGAGYGFCEAADCEKINGKNEDPRSNGKWEAYDNRHLCLLCLSNSSDFLSRKADRNDRDYRGYGYNMSHKPTSPARSCKSQSSLHGEPRGSTVRPRSGSSARTSSGPVTRPRALSARSRGKKLAQQFREKQAIALQRLNEMDKETDKLAILMKTDEEKFRDAVVQWTEEKGIQKVSSFNGRFQFNLFLTSAGLDSCISKYTSNLTPSEFGQKSKHHTSGKKS